MTFHCSLGNPNDGTEKKLLEWAAEKLGIPSWTTDSQAIGVIETETGAIAAVAVYNGFTGSMCSIHLVSDGKRRWLSGRTAFGILGYPFNVLDLERLSGYIAASRTDALILALRMGFQFEGRLREAFQGEDVIVLGLLRKDAGKWLNWREGDDG